MGGFFNCGFAEANPDLASLGLNALMPALGSHYRAEEGSTYFDYTFGILPQSRNPALAKIYPAQESDDFERSKVTILVAKYLKLHYKI